MLLPSYWNMAIDASTISEDAGFAPSAVPRDPEALTRRSDQVVITPQPGIELPLLQIL